MTSNFGPSSTRDTQKFYEGLSSGAEKRGLWGKESRFNPDVISAKPSVGRHFVEIIAPYLSVDATCLDLGCGPGGFLGLMAPYCKSIVGVDVVPSFVEECRAHIAHLGLTNASVMLNEDPKLPFPDAEFDRIVMIDTIHHLEDVPATLGEVHRLLKPNGLFLVFEPNKLNPLLAALCALDRNEHGLLRMGTFKSYRKLFEQKFKIEHEAYNGLLVGPSGKLATTIADFVSDPRVAPVAGWLSPKLFLAARKV